MAKTPAKTVGSASLDTARKGSRRSAAKPRKRQPRPASAKAENPAPASDKRISKRDQLAALLVRNEGATIDQMREATEWLPHTVRAALTSLRKLGYAIDSDKVDGLRTYRAVAPR